MTPSTTRLGLCCLLLLVTLSILCVVNHNRLKVVSFTGGGDMLPSIAQPPAPDTIRFLYTKGTGIVRAYHPRSISTQGPPNMDSAGIIRAPLTEDNSQKANVMFTLLVDCSLLSKWPKNDFELASLRENSGKPPDPGVYCRKSADGFYYAYSQASGVEAGNLKLPNDGTVAIAYVCNLKTPSGQNASLIVDEWKPTGTDIAALTPNWSTGLTNGVATFHSSVLEASFLWSDTHVFKYVSPPKPSATLSQTNSPLPTCGNWCLDIPV